MKEGNFLNKEGKVNDPEIAKKMADVEKPYREKAMKRLFGFGKNKIIKQGEKEANQAGIMAHRQKFFEGNGKSSDFENIEINKKEEPIGDHKKNEVVEINGKYKGKDLRITVKKHFENSNSRNSDMKYTGSSILGSLDEIELDRVEATKLYNEIIEKRKDFLK